MANAPFIPSEASARGARKNLAAWVEANHGLRYLHRPWLPEICPRYLRGLTKFPCRRVAPSYRENPPCHQRDDLPGLSPQYTLLDHGEYWKYGDFPVIIAHLYHDFPVDYWRKWLSPIDGVPVAMLALPSAASWWNPGGTHVSVVARMEVIDYLVAPGGVSRCVYQLTP